MPDLAEPDRTSMIEVNRTELRMWEWGPVEARPVLLVHGAFDHGRMWDGIAPALVERGFRVVAPDLRGHGDSGRLASGHVWASCGTDLGFLARHLGGEVGMIGHSFGGGQAMFAAAAWPELVPWVVVLDGLGPPATAFDDAVDRVEVATKSFDSLDRIRNAPPRVYATREEMVDRRAAVNQRLPRPWVEHLVEHGAAPVDGGFVWKSDPIFNIGFPGPFGLEHLRAEFEAVTCPVLALTGGSLDTWSELTSTEIDERLGWLDTPVHRVIRGAGHYVHIEQPEATLNAIDDFLSGLDG